MEIKLHTDSQAADDYNMKLSSGRVQTLMDYIVSNGIN